MNLKSEIVFWPWRLYCPTPKETQAWGFFPSNLQQTLSTTSSSHPPMSVSWQFNTWCPQGTCACGNRKWGETNSAKCPRFEQFTGIEPVVENISTKSAKCPRFEPVAENISTIVQKLKAFQWYENALQEMVTGLTSPCLTVICSPWFTF